MHFSCTIYNELHRSSIRSSSNSAIKYIAYICILISAVAKKWCIVWAVSFSIESCQFGKRIAYIADSLGPRRAFLNDFFTSIPKSERYFVSFTASFPPRTKTCLFLSSQTFCRLWQQQVKEEEGHKIQNLLCILIFSQLSFILDVSLGPAFCVEGKCH